MALTIQLKVPDEVDQDYFVRNPKNKYGEMEKTLKKFSKVDPGGRFLMVPPEAIREIEEALGEQVTTVDTLVKVLKKMVTLRVDGEDYILPKEHIEEMEQRAKFWGQTPQEYMSQEVKRALIFMVKGTY